MADLEVDEVFAGAAHDLDDAAAPFYGDDDDVEMEDVVAAVTSRGTATRTAGGSPGVLCGRLRGRSEALSADGLLRKRYGDLRAVPGWTRDDLL